MRATTELKDTMEFSRTHFEEPEGGAGLIGSALPASTDGRVWSWPAQAEGWPASGLAPATWGGWPGRGIPELASPLAD